MKLLLLAPFLLCSCLATQAALENAEAATARLNAVMDSQTATVGELETAAKDQADSLADLGAAMAADIANVVDMAKSGTPWGEIAGAGAAAAAAAFFGTNRYRDGRRATRGEATGITRPPA